MVDDLITQIANGGSFDQVAAIRAIARKLIAMDGGAAKAAPVPTMEVPAEGTAPGASGRKGKAPAEA